jgi:hypothetical protein
MAARSEQKYFNYGANPTTIKAALISHRKKQK